MTKSEPGAVAASRAAASGSSVSGFSQKTGIAELEDALDERGMRARRGRHDDRVERREFVDVLDDRRRSAFARAGDARVRAGDDGHLAAERAEIAEDVTTPPAAADEAYDHAGTA